MFRHYTGKKLCPGCKISGEVKYRYGADELCEDCKNLIRLGKTVKAEPKNFSVIERSSYTLGSASRYKSGDNSNSTFVRSGKPYYDSGTSRLLCDALNKLMGTLNEGLKPDWEYRVQIEDNWTDLTIYIKTDTALAYFEFIDAIAKYGRSIAKEEFERGKNLLVGLNSGDLTLKDFEQRK